MLFLNEGHIDEMGGMNVLFVQNGRLRTPPLTDTILRGVTRDSLLTIAKDLGIETSEAPIALDEIVAGVKDGSVTEMIACGTAAVVIGIRALLFEDGTKLEISGAAPGRVTSLLYDTLVDIQYGRAADRHGWLQRVCRADAPEGAEARAAVRRSLARLLRFAAERTAVGAGVQRLAAVPAEARLRRFARLEPRLDVLGTPRRVRRPAAERQRGRGVRRGLVAARRQHVVEQLARPLVARVDVRRHRLQDDVVDRLGNLRVLRARAP